MASDGDPDGALSSVEVGSRLSVHVAARDKWAYAIVSHSNNTHTLPLCLVYDDGGVAWARVAAAGVLVTYRAPKKGNHSAGDPPPAGAASAAEACAFIQVPTDAKTTGRPSKAVKEAKSAALEAAGVYRQQQKGQQQQQAADGSEGSPKRRRRLSRRAIHAAAADTDITDAAAADAAADEGSERVQLPTPGSAALGSLARQQAGSNGELAGGRQLQRASPAAAAVASSDRAQEAAVPLGKGSTKAAAAPAQQSPGAPQQHEAEAVPAAAAAAAAAPAEAGEQQAAGSSQQQEAAGCDKQQQRQRQQAGAAAPGAAVPGSAARAAAAAAVLGLKRPAVTDLSMRPAAALSSLSTVKVDEGDGQEGEERPARPAKPSRPRDRPRDGQKAKQECEQPRSRSSDAKRAQQQQQQQQSPGLPAEQQADEEAAAAAPAVERPGDAACRHFAELLSGLTGARDSIHGTANAALEAGQAGAAKEAVLAVLDHVETQVPAGRRVPFLFLLDAILGKARKEGPPTVAQLFARAVGAALSRLVDLLGASVEDARKMEKTLSSTWCLESKRGINASLVQMALQNLRARIAQHEAAWGDGASGDAGGGGPPDGAAGGGERAAREAEAELRALLRRPFREAPCLVYTNAQDGSKLELTHVWQPDEWPDYDSLPPLPPGADRWMWARVKAAAAAVEAAQLGAAPLSPWHYSFNASEWADEPGVLEQAAAHAAAINEERQRLVAAAQAQHVAAAQQRAEAAQRAAQSTSAAAKIDEFDAGFFREVAGAVSAAHLQQQYALVDGGWDVDVVPLSLPPLPPLPDQPPLPDEDWQDDDDDAYGPPPLPPHSPPRDEFEMEMDVEDEEAPPLPPLPPPDDSQPAPPTLQAAAATPTSVQQQHAQQQQDVLQQVSYTPWGSHGVPPSFAQQAAAQPAAAAVAHAMPAAGNAYGAQPAPWQKAAQPAAAAAPHPLVPPGIGVSPAAALAVQQSAAAAQHAAAQDPHLAPWQQRQQQQLQQQRQQFAAHLGAQAAVQAHLQAQATAQAQQAQQAQAASHAEQQAAIMQTQQAAFPPAAFMHLQAQQAAVMQAQRAALAAGMIPPGLHGALPPGAQQPMLFPPGLVPPGMPPGMQPPRPMFPMPAAAQLQQQQQQQHAFAPGQQPQLHGMPPPSG